MKNTTQQQLILKALSDKKEFVDTLALGISMRFLIAPTEAQEIAQAYYQERNGFREEFFNQEYSPYDYRRFKEIDNCALGNVSDSKPHSG